MLPSGGAGGEELLLRGARLFSDEALLGRYLDWMGGVLTGDFGKTVTGGDINDQLGSRALVSLRLLVLGSIIGGLFGGLFVAAAIWITVGLIAMVVGWFMFRQAVELAAELSK